MKFLIRLWSAFVAWLFGKESKQARYAQPPYALELVEGSFPKILHPRVVYVLTEDGDPWEAKFICPCGCGAELELNLLPDTRPVWRVAQGVDGRVTLHPSVWRKVGCRSHFWIRDGAVLWS